MAGLLLIHGNVALGKKDRKPPLELGGTRWTVSAEATVRRKALERKRWRSTGRDRSTISFALRLDPGGLFTMEGPDGQTTATGQWSRKRNRVRLDLAETLPPTAGAFLPGGIPNDSAGGEIRVRKWSLRGVLRTGGSGSHSLRTRYKFKFTVEDPPRTFTYSGTSKGTGALDPDDPDPDPDPDPPADPPNNPPTARIASDAPGGKVSLAGGLAVVLLSGVDSDDGDGGAQGLSFRWSKLSGPEGDQIEDPLAASTRVTFTSTGARIYELTVDDGQENRNTARTTTRVVVTAEPVNRPPVARVDVDPPDATVTLMAGTAAVTLDASGSDDGDDGTQGLAYEWSKQSGPEGDVVQRPSSLRTVVSFRAEGVYTYSLTVDDGQELRSTDSAVVEIRVLPPPVNHPPVVMISSEPLDGFVELRSGRARAVLDGSASDDGDGGAAELLFDWKRIAGPGGDTLADPTSPLTEVLFTQAGSYVYELTVREAPDGLESTGTIAIDVKRPENTATLTWAPPRENEDGSDLTDLAGFKVYHGICNGDVSSCLDEGNREPPEFDDVGSATEHTLEDLETGVTYYFYVTAYDRSRNESVPSAVVFKAIPSP